MFTKIYWVLWTTMSLITVALFATGNLGWLGITVIGFVACTLAFMGMICLTPTIVGPHAEEFQHADAEPLAKKDKPPMRERFARIPVSVQNRHA
jgi:hypothetical protein